MSIHVLAFLLIATTYNGRVSNELGYIGLKTEDDRGTRAIERVRYWSPADMAGITKKDYVLGCDGVRGGSIIGPAYTIARVMIRRDGKEMVIDVMRVPMRVIKEREQKYYYDCGFEPGAKIPAFEDAR